MGDWERNYLEKIEQCLHILKTQINKAYFCENRRLESASRIWQH